MITPFNVSIVPLASIDVTQPFFDSLKESYPEFSTWLAKASRFEGLRFAVEAKDEEGNYLGLAIVKRAEIINGYKLRGVVSKISTFKVAERATGRGLGTLLLETVFQELGKRLAYVEVYPDQRALQSFLLRHGFRLFPTLSGKGENVFFRDNY